MAIVTENVAHKTLTDGSQITLHSHLGGGGLPDLVVTKNSTSVNQTIADGYCAVIVGWYRITEVTGTSVVTLAGNSVLKII